MSDIAEYSTEELETLVQQALVETESSEARTIFSAGDTQLLAHLADVLPNYVRQADTNVIFDELREKIYEGQLGRQDPQKSMRALHGSVLRCRMCPAVKPEPNLPKWNVVDPDVVFIQNMPMSSSEADKFFVDALLHTGFRSARLCVSSVVRCFPDELRQPNAEEVSSCTKRFLFNELRILQPRLIVCLGGLPASILLGGDIKVTEERGKLFWVGPWPVFVTYSPAYAMRTERQANEFQNDITRTYEFLYGK